MQLCTLADVKTLLDIAPTDLSRDAKLGLFIADISAAAQRFLEYPVSRASYVGETYTVNNHQYLYLRHKPIQSVSLVTLVGVTVNQGTGDGDWQMTEEDAAAGRLYKGDGWVGPYFTREMTYDMVAGVRAVLVSYVAGWLLPGVIGYDPDDATNASLPYAITAAVQNEVVRRARLSAIRGEGLQSVSEGGVSVTIDKRNQDGSQPLDISGLSKECQAALSPYRRWSTG